MCDLETLLLLLPQLAAVDVISVAVVDGTLAITAATHAVPARCTGCGWFSARMHSTYERRVADEAVGGRPVRIDLTVRRLYCENADCLKTTFAEQAPGLTCRYQRRTPALQNVVDVVALALAGCGQQGDHFVAPAAHRGSGHAVAASQVGQALVVSQHGQHDHRDPAWRQAPPASPDRLETGSQQLRNVGDSARGQAQTALVNKGTGVPRGWWFFVTQAQQPPGSLWLRAHGSQARGEPAVRVSASVWFLRGRTA